MIWSSSLAFHHKINPDRSRREYGDRQNCPPENLSIRYLEICSYSQLIHPLFFCRMVYSTLIGVHKEVPWHVSKGHRDLQSMF